jgi:hypothetical protein
LFVWFVFDGIISTINKGVSPNEKNGVGLLQSNNGLACEICEKISEFGEVDEAKMEQHSNSFAQVVQPYTRPALHPPLLYAMLTLYFYFFIK